MAQVHDKKFEGDIEDMLEKVVKFLKKQFKAVTKKTLSLSPQREIKVKVESMSRIRTWVTAQRIYKIGSVDIEELGNPNEKLQYSACFCHIGRRSCNTGIRRPQNHSDWA
jgi:hypothetical protein